MAQATKTEDQDEEADEDRAIPQRRQGLDTGQACA